MNEGREYKTQRNIELFNTVLIAAGTIIAGLIKMEVSDMKDRIVRVENVILTVGVNSLTDKSKGVQPWEQSQKTLSLQSLPSSMGPVKSSQFGSLNMPGSVRLSNPSPLPAGLPQPPTETKSERKRECLLLASGVLRAYCETGPVGTYPYRIAATSQPESSRPSAAPALVQP